LKEQCIIKMGCPKVRQTFLMIKEYGHRRGSILMEQSMVTGNLS